MVLQYMLQWLCAVCVVYYIISYVDINGVSVRDYITQLCMLCWCVVDKCFGMCVCCAVLCLSLLHAVCVKYCDMLRKCAQLVTRR